MKLACDPNATKEPGDDASLEELKKIVEFHLERIAPVPRPTLNAGMRH
jgi:hypothetical protein